jgi:hypothetical protein
MSPSRQLHDLVSRDATGAATAHMLDERLSAVHRPWCRSLPHAYRPSIDLELDLGVWQKTKRFPNLDGDGNLSFARDTHRYYSYR